LDVTTDQARRLAVRFGLTPDERDDLLSYFNEVLVRRLLPRDTDTMRPDELRASLWRYYDAGYRNGRPWGAGWYATTLLKRRPRTTALGDADGRPTLDPPDPGGDAWDALLRRDDLQRELERDAERARRGARRRAAARPKLARYLREARATDRVALSGRAAGLTYREIAARELGREPSRREVNTMVQRYRRAWARMPPPIGRELEALCPPPVRDVRKGRRAGAGA